MGRFTTVQNAKEVELYKNIKLVYPTDKFLEAVANNTHHPLRVDASVVLGLYFNNKIDFINTMPLRERVAAVEN